MRWATAGTLPAGYKRTDQFVALPAAPGRTFLVSLGSRRGASSALTSYNALRSGQVRMARRAIGLGLRSGLVRPLLRDTFEIGIAAGVVQGHLAGELLEDHLTQMFGRGPVVLAIGSGLEGPYRKPVLQVFSASGQPLGFIKVGWNDWTREAVKREATALRACQAREMALGVPPLLSLSAWRGLDLLVTGPLPGHVRKLSNKREPDADLLREISELAPVHTGDLAASQWWASVRSRIEGATADQAARSALELAADRVEHGYGRMPLTFGAWHGDLVPWNLGRCGARLFAWDWESSTPDVPLGFDAVHFHYSVAFIARRRPLAEALQTAADRAGTALGALGIDESARRLIAALHVIELAVRHEEARAGTGETDPRFSPAVTRVLQGVLPPPRGQAGQQPTGRAA